jgi:branched-chain amino acid transport system ATP-binding protein
MSTGTGFDRNDPWPHPPAVAPYVAPAAPAATAELTPQPLLELSGVKACYGAIEVLHGVDLDLRPGEVMAVLGPNGAGKTTTLKVLAGLHPLAGGDVWLAGRRVNGARPDDMARVGLCLIPEGRGIFPSLTVRENLRMATYRGCTMRHVEDSAYGRFPPLAKRRNQVAGTLSGGEQQMLALARGLSTDPAVLILDELSMGLAPMVVEQLYGQVAEMARTGISILVVEQFARVVLGVADRAAIMLHGRVSEIGTPREIESKLSTAYLGG